MQRLDDLFVRLKAAAAGTADPSRAGDQAKLLVTTASPVLMLFAATFLIGAGLVLWLIHLRTGVYELQDLPIFYSLFVFLDYWPAIVGLMITAAGLLRPVQSFALRIVEAIGNRPYRTAMVTLLLLAVGSRFAYQGHPLSMDEYSPYFQSRAFANGSLTGKFPVELLDWLIPSGFQNVFLNVSRSTGQVASAYMPGFALLLTPFTAAGIPWLCNPVLGAASIIVLHRLAMGIFNDARVAGLAALLAVASTAFSINAMSFYSMTAHALANGIFALLLLKPSVQRCFLAGIVGSFALVLHNPVPHALFALPWLTWLMLRRDRSRLLPAVAAGYLPIFVLLGVGWMWFSLELKATVLAPGATASSFREPWIAGLLRFLTLPSSELLFVRGIGLAKLWIWSVPVLVCAAIAGAWSGKSDIRLRLLALSCIMTLLGFLFVEFSQGHGWGFRYFHSAWLCLPLLAVAAVRPLAKSAPLMPHTPFSYVSAVAVLALLFAMPLQVWQVHGFISQHLAQVPTSNTGTPRLVVISPSMGYYAVDLVQNDPFLRDPVTYMVSAGRAANRDMVQRHYPELSLLSSSFKGEVWGRPPPE